MDDVATDPEVLASSEEWRRMLTGEDPALQSLRRWWKRIPSSPRCKVCAAPFHGLGRLATGVIMHGRSQSNPLLCNLCFGKLRQHAGGAEVEISVLFADVRGSTGIAERLPAAEYRRLLQRLYVLATKAIEQNSGIVDKFLGDGVMALFVPFLTGEDHAGRAIAAGQELLEAVERSELRAAGLRVGAGIHAGTAFVGVMGTDERLDFTALGDTVNVAARLGSLAGPGQLLVSGASWDAGPRSGEITERRSVQVAGRAEPLEIVVVQIQEEVAPAA
jgi:adenylate cyclase